MNNMTNSTWNLLAEITLYMEPDDLDKAAELMSGLLVEAMGKSRIPAINEQKIKDSLGKIMVNARNQSIQGGIVLPLMIKAYSQIGNGIITPQHTANEMPALTQKQMDSSCDIVLLAQRNELEGDQCHLGWGHFTLERFVDNADLPDETPYHLIEIYFYNEVSSD